MEYTNWVITTDDKDDQVAKGCEAFKVMKEFSQQTDVFIIANNKVDCWLVNDNTGEKVQITHHDAEQGIIICEGDEISFKAALRNLERNDTMIYI
ncbi:hypothetical protein DL89DRAFT_130998 [Linderina pennispora]|uniref:Uncharacterized protein n=1 Tax=Linderina pennispora TaxID=61395 RepID=A0A1Y1VW04_9FUNG|nr:uncharacterized protein DL89DRAFT_130998 [Linderina pennispora]ORX65195.1 hypothetical protein DL89DRAFT_130998 [Linderina pennispora]